MFSLLVGTATLVMGAAQVPPVEADTPEHAVRSFYAALANDDEQAFSRLAANNFYAFDVGKRFAGKELFEAIKGIHASGKCLVWNLGPIDVHVSGTVACAAWENHGAVGITPVFYNASLNSGAGKWRSQTISSSDLRRPALAS